MAAAKIIVVEKNEGEKKSPMTYPRQKLFSGMMI